MRIVAFFSIDLVHIDFLKQLVAKFIIVLILHMRRVNALGLFVDGLNLEQLGFSYRFCCLSFQMNDLLDPLFLLCLVLYTLLAKEVFK